MSERVIKTTAIANGLKRQEVKFVINADKFESAVNRFINARKRKPLTK